MPWVYNHIARVVDDDRPRREDVTNQDRENENFEVKVKPGQPPEHEHGLSSWVAFRGAHFK